MGLIFGRGLTTITAGGDLPTTARAGGQRLHDSSWDFEKQKKPRRSGAGGAGVLLADLAKLVAIFAEQFAQCSDTRL